IASNHYALESNANSNVVDSLSKLRKQSFEGYLRDYLETLKSGLQKQCENSQGWCIANSKDNITLTNLQTTARNILNALKNSKDTNTDIANITLTNQADNKTETIPQALTSIISEIEKNTIGSKKATMTEEQIKTNGMIDTTQYQAAKSNSAYLSPSFGINALMLFQMLQEIASGNQNVNYAYALGYAYRNFSNDMRNNVFNNVYTYGGGATLEKLIQSLDPNLITIYNQFGNGLKAFSKILNSQNAMGSASVFELTARELEKQISALSFSNDPTKEKDKQQALGILNQLLTDIPIYDAQTNNPMMQLSAWANDIAYYSPITVRFDPTTYQVEGVVGGAYCGNACTDYQTSITTPQQLYHTILEWWDNVGNVANSLNSHNPKEIGTAIQSFGNFYNEQWKNNPHYQQGGSYPNKDQIKQILSNINKTLPTQDQVSQNTFNSWTNFLALPPKLNTYNELQSSKPIALASLSTLASMFNQMNYLSSPTTKLINNDKDIETKQQGYMLGFGIKGGYKQMFDYYIKGNQKSKKKYGQFGLRYYAF
ncbi:hypothetical protein, partial [Helicobacter cetorum]|uniref:hypothetical protein n=1 Tax=Helicobacter cetorum TaxID=138563 RepID=UPI000CF19924